MIIIIIVETIQHTTGVRRALAQGDYTQPHNQVASTVHQELSTVDNQTDDQCRIVNMRHNPCLGTPVINYTMTRT